MIPTREEIKEIEYEFTIPQIYNLSPTLSGCEKAHKILSAYISGELVKCPSEKEITNKIYNEICNTLEKGNRDFSMKEFVMFMSMDISKSIIKLLKGE